MRKVIYFLLMVCFVLSNVNQAQAQLSKPPKKIYEELSKDEKKKWKKEAKEYSKDPRELKILYEEHKFYKRNVDQLSDQIATLQSSSSDNVERANTLEMQVTRLRRDLQAAQNRVEELSNQEPIVATEREVPDEMGIMFKVQIGAYGENQLTDELVTTEDLGVENTESVQKIVVGKFREYDQAVQLKDHLKAVGVQDAWIVSYKDGIRVPINEIHNN